MNDYLQPEFYRFNEDSLRLVRWILKKDPKVSSILDLGAGCGVIGIELANTLKPQLLTLLEVQEDYLPFLSHNCQHMLNIPLVVETISSSFSQWTPSRKYELIACNPPYYLPGHGEAARDPRREIARSFVLDNWRVLLEKIKSSLAENGKGYLVIKKNQQVLSVIHELQSAWGIGLHEEEHLCFLELSGLDVNRG